MYRNPELEEIRALLRSSGVRYRNGAKYFQVRCPYHDDRNPSAVVYKDNGFFKCFTCLTEKPFHKFYKDLMGTDWDGKLNLSLSMFRNNKLNVVKERIMNEKFYFASSEKKKDVSSESLVKFDSPLKNVCDVREAKIYCDSREISGDFIDFFGLKVLEEGKVNGALWTKRLIIPLKNERGAVCCAEGRDYTRKQEKKVLYPADCSVNYIFNSANLDAEKTLIVTEGVMDVHKIWRWITKNVTCTFGVLLKELQKEQLKKFKDVILFIDDDEAGRRSIKAFEEFYPYNFRVTVSKNNDPGSSTRKELERAVENAKPFNEFLMDDVGIFPEVKKMSLRN